MSRFQDWEIKECIGEGAFGKVYRITKEEFGHTYEAALKVINVPQQKAEVDAVRHDGMSEENVTEYFKSIVKDIVDEFVLMSKLKGNSNIVSYEDHAVIELKDRFGWQILIRMELLTPLYVYRKENTFTEWDVVQMGIDICKALEVCQKFNIIHRDIKPENIFFSEVGTYKLGDFGIARQLEKTSSGLSRKGTMTYMAPEIYHGLEYNAQVDIYSLGIMLYRFLNDDRSPFMPAYPEPLKYSDKEKANIERFKGKEFPKPRHASEELSKVILKACAFEPKERYQNPLEMRKALEAVQIEENLEVLLEVSNRDTKESADNLRSDEKSESYNMETVVMTGDIDMTPTSLQSESPFQTVAMKEDINLVQQKNKSEQSKKKKTPWYLLIAGILIVGIIGGVFFIQKGKSTPKVLQSKKESFVEKKTIVEKVSPTEKPTSTPDVVNIPNIVGKNISEAKTILKNAKIPYSVKKQYSGKKRGVVISQSKEAGQEVALGTKIQITISQGEQKITVPNLNGLVKESAAKKLEKLELKYKYTYKYNNEVAKGHVIKLSPKSGKKVKKGTLIIIIVSDGPAYVAPSENPSTEYNNNSRPSKPQIAPNTSF